jgi:NTE family protein
VRTNITMDHLLASSAIPILFPAVRVNREFFGDGALRQLSPISPALHLGAKRVLIIGVSGQPRQNIRRRILSYPSIAQIAGHILNSSFIDGLEADIERLTRINKTLALIPENIRKRHSRLNHVDVFTLSPPAETLDQIAMKYKTLLPKSIHMFMRGSGATRRSGSGVLSYLLFEADYCKELMKLGYDDAVEKREELLQFLGLEKTNTTATDVGSVEQRVVPQEEA